MADEAVKAKKPFILKRMGKGLSRFFREYKSEIKKITWPKFNAVVRNTIIVLVMLLFVGIIIWPFDYGLTQLRMLIIKQ